MKILIVENQYDMAETIREHLSCYDCTIATNSKLASELLGTEVFDLVITDIDLGISQEKGGGERILSECSTKDPKTPAFVYTGQSHLKDDFYRDIGATAVFYKPGIASLINAVHLYACQISSQAS